jgi:peroxiredoxin Q/BCP
MLYGKSFLGIVRTTFLIDGNGIIVKIISKVDTKNHSEQIFKIYQ